MIESKLKIIAPPDFLTRIGVPTVDADRLVADGDATAAPDLNKSAESCFVG